MDLIPEPDLDVGYIPFAAWCLRICNHWFTMIFSSNGASGNLILLLGKPDNAKIKQNYSFNHGTGHLCVRPVTCACANCCDWYHYLGHSGGYQDCSSDTSTCNLVRKEASGLSCQVEQLPNSQWEGKILRFSISYSLMDEAGQMITY